MTLDGVPFLSHFPMEIQKISIKKRLFDIMASIGLLIILYFPFLIIGIWIKIVSPSGSIIQGQVSTPVGTPIPPAPCFGSGCTVNVDSSKG